MHKNVVRSLVSAVAAGILFSTSAATMAAQDSASSDITLSFTPTIEIAAVGDVSITDPALGSDAVASEDFCIGGFGFPTFSITFESDDDNNDPAFTLTDGAGLEVPYSVGFDNSTSGTFTAVNAGQAVTGQTRNAASCSGSDNARFQITVANGDWQTSDVLNGTDYTDTLLITVASE
ncbi:hypothetical protein [Microbulbifer sp. THAF38]|uniref:hypothetical protein n=1 Tax=Microbulbifer sp. THAF38 TaxID=2587856 RepID=UPI00126813A9|nr:hypothetical protein [Microbulbifer sp. THAF38]QFT53763.1 hypothetical protein FIU95_04135 [Microbulbifer sp. THAF38]